MIFTRLVLKQIFSQTSIRNLIAKARTGYLIMTDIHVAEFRQRLSDFYTKWFHGLEAGRPAVSKPFTGQELDNRVGEIESPVKEFLLISQTMEESAKTGVFLRSG